MLKSQWKVIQEIISLLQWINPAKRCMESTIIFNRVISPCYLMEAKESIFGIY